MQLLSLLSFLPLSLAALPAVNPETRTYTTSTPLLTLYFPPTAAAPNPQLLPARTFATLSTANLTLKATFRRNSTFVFNDVPLGSYLGEIWTGPAGVNTVPMRVDVLGPDGRDSSAVPVAREDKIVKIWQTFRANEWSNKGEVIGEGNGREGLSVNIQVLGARDVYEKRTGFSPISLLKNPMILMGIVGMALMFGMPKIMENMDPEMKKEFEEQQRSSGLAGALTGQGGGGFDAASWLAGSSSTPKERTDSPARSSGTETKGGKKRRG